MLAVGLARMTCNFGRWRGEDQPTVTRINRGKAKDVSEKSAIRGSVPAVDYGVDACDHEAHCSRRRFRLLRTIGEIRCPPRPVWLCARPACGHVIAPPRNVMESHSLMASRSRWLSVRRPEFH